MNISLSACNGRLPVALIFLMNTYVRRIVRAAFYIFLQICWLVFPTHLKFNRSLRRHKYLWSAINMVKHILISNVRLLIQSLSDYARNVVYIHLFFFYWLAFNALFLSLRVIYISIWLCLALSISIHVHVCANNAGLWGRYSYIFPFY